MLRVKFAAVLFACASVALAQQSVVALRLGPAMVAPAGATGWHKGLALQEFLPVGGTADNRHADSGVCALG